MYRNNSGEKHYLKLKKDDVLYSLDDPVLFVTGTDENAIGSVHCIWVDKGDELQVECKRYYRCVLRDSSVSCPMWSSVCLALLSILRLSSTFFLPLFLFKVAVRILSLFPINFFQALRNGRRRKTFPRKARSPRLQQLCLLSR